MLRELPGWGYLYNFAADFRSEWLWAGAPVREMRGRISGYTTRHDLSKWSERGTYFLGRWHDLGMQSFVTDVIGSTKTIVDVGANRGEFSLFASNVVKQGKVISFEPNPQCRDTLENDISRNSITNIEVIPAGLSERAATLTMSIPSGHSVEGTFSKLDGPNVVTILSQVVVGDEVLERETPALFKIDVEGFECKVIAGIVETIARCRPIIITEVERVHLERCGDSPEKLRNLIEGQGYEGYCLRLQKRAGKYTWALSPMDMKQGFDAVWVPRERLSDLIQPHRLITV